MTSLRRDILGNPGWGVNTQPNSRRDSVVSNASSRRESLVTPNRRYSYSRRFSTDSLENRRNSWDPSRRGSSGSSIGWDDPIWEDKKVKFSLVSNSLTGYMEYYFVIFVINPVVC